MNLYPLDTIQQFEFDKLKKLVAAHCRCAPSRLMVNDMAPVKNVDALLLLLNQTNEYKRILDNKMFFPDSTFTDLSVEINLLRIAGAFLTEEQFSNIRYVSDIVNSITKFLNERAKQYAALHVIVKDIQITNEIINAINEIIDPKGEVKSSASKELGDIRRDLSAKRKEADKRFRNFVNDLKRLGWLRDNEENFYNGRRVLSVLAEHKRDVKGLVHGSSDTGKTTFIEPFNTIEINNEVVALEQDEKREIYRLLRALADKIRPHLNLIKNYQQALTTIDFTRAKALFAIEIKGHLPHIEKQPSIKLINAVHPLLYLQNKQAQKNTVPLSVDMNVTDRIIIISGPNAGGKSITLKTIGLLQIMLQSGLLVSAAEHSIMSFFHHLHSDIGDSQSIEAELSTYSGRLIKMKYILENANRRTLVLIDEFGTGSDPELGGAIAEVLLEELSKKKSFGIVTTHYTNIKLLAENLNGVSNASMLFDPETLQPKYQLMVGQPGSSYTFEVAQKIGLPQEILARAGKKVQREKLKLNSMLSELQRDKNKLELQLKQYGIKEKAAEMATQKFDELSDKLNSKLDKERERMEEQTKLAELGRKLNALGLDWEKNPNKKEVIGKFVSLMTAEKKKRVEKISIEKQQKKKEKTLEKKKAIIKVGTEVKLFNSRQTGIVQEIIKNKARVTFGSIKSLISIENLETVD